MNDSFLMLRRWSDQLFSLLFVDALASLYVLNTAYEVSHHLTRFAQGQVDLNRAVLSQQEKLAGQELNLLLLAAAIFVLYLIWFHRLATNTNQFSTMKLKLRPGALVVYHLIFPLVQLFVPLWAMTQIWKASSLHSGNKRSMSFLVIVWWLLGVTSVSLALVALGFSQGRLEYYLPSLTLTQMYLGTRIAFDIVFMVMIRRIMVLQDFGDKSSGIIPENRCISCGEPIDANETICPMCGNSAGQNHSKLPLP